MCLRHYRVSVYNDEGFKLYLKISIFWNITPCSPVNAGAQLAAGCMVVFCFAYSSTQKMETTYSSETSVDFHRPI
jgi:hypothetical protein